MQLRYVFSETGTGLRRNVSMSVALILTITVSLTLLGMGLLLNAQAKKAEESWGSKLQITAYLCNQNSQGSHCTSGEATAQQETAIEQVLHSHPEVASYKTKSKEQAYATLKKIYASSTKSDQQIFATVTPKDMRKSYVITLKDPRKYQSVESALSGMDGVDSVQDLRRVLGPVYQWMSIFKWGAIGVAAFLLVAAIAQVANTIRLAVFARRKEIGIMRLVGASSMYISIPFLMETLAAAVISIVIAGLVIGAFMQFAVYDGLRESSRIMEWINWGDGVTAFVSIAIIGVVLVAVPTLVMTRKYLKV